MKESNNNNNNFKIQSPEDIKNNQNKPIIQNYFRGHYVQNKNEKEKERPNYFTPRIKESEVKGKPKLLTNRLPDAFTVKPKETTIQNHRRIYQTNTRENLYNRRNDSAKMIFKNDDDYEIPQKETRHSSVPRQKTSNDLSPFNDNSYNENINQMKTEGNDSGKKYYNSKENNYNYLNVSKIKIKNKYYQQNIPKPNTKSSYSANISFHNSHSNFAPKIQLDETDLSIGNENFHNKENTNHIIDNNNNNNYNNAINSLHNNNGINLEDGITYKVKNGYKYYIHIPTVNLYFIKEIKFTYSQTLIKKISDWNKNFYKHENYLKIYQYFVNNPEGYFSILIEQPIGDTINDYINSIGFCDNFCLSRISQKIYELIKNMKYNSYEEVFCGCDLFFDISNKLKVYPPFLRNINYSTHLCECKQILFKICKIYQININPYFCLGYLMIKMMSGNIKLVSFKYLISYYEEIKKNNNCCLFHTLIYIEEKFLNKKEFLLKDLLKFYSPELKHFLCECLSFDSNRHPTPQNEWLNLYDISQRIRVTIKELLRIVQKNLKENKFKTIDEFMNNYEIIYNNLKLNGGDKSSYINQQYFQNLYNHKYIISMICRCFEIEKEEFMSKLINIICGKEHSPEKKKISDPYSSINLEKKQYSNSYKKNTHNSAYIQENDSIYNGNNHISKERKNLKY